MLDEYGRRRWQRARLVEIEKDLYPVFRRTGHEVTQCGAAPLNVRLPHPRQRREMAQFHMQPHRVFACRRQPGEQPVGIRIECRVEQRVAAQGEVGVSHAQRRFFVGSRRAPVTRERGLQRPDKREKRIGTLQPSARKNLSHHTGDLCRTRVLFCRRRRPAQRLALRFEQPQFVKEEIVLAQRVGESFRRPTEQREDLVVGQQMPVAADERQVRAATLLVVKAAWRLQPHAAAERDDVGRLRTHHFRQTPRRHQCPVTPHEGMQPTGKPRRFQRCGSAAHRQDIDRLGRARSPWHHRRPGHDGQ